MSEPRLPLGIGHLGGALGRQPKAPNAVSNRDAAFTLFVAGIGGPADAAAVTAAEDALIEKLKPWSTGQMFLNFMTSPDVAPAAVRRAYQPQVYQPAERRGRDCTVAPQ